MHVILIHTPDTNHQHVDVCQYKDKIRIPTVISTLHLHQVWFRLRLRGGGTNVLIELQLELDLEKT